MKINKGFTLLEILLYVVVGGITLVITGFSFVQITRLSTTFRVNNELNQTGDNMIRQIENIINEDSNPTIVSPSIGAAAANSITIRENNSANDTIITQTGTDIIVSFTDGRASFNINPVGIQISNTPSPSLLFEQIDNSANEQVSLSQSIKVKFTLVYQKPTLSGNEYDASKSFETIITLSKTKSPFIPVLNDYPVGVNGIAYSLRKLSGINTDPNIPSLRYAGPAIRVRRDRGADQAESDIGFTKSGDLDTVSLQNFVGYQNFLTWSEDITNTTGSWGVNNITTIADNTADPNGLNTAEKINLNAGNTQRFMNKDTILTNGSIYTDSYYVKANNPYNFVQITPSTGFATGAYQNYNLTNGTLAGSSGMIAGQSTITPVGNGWYRISLSATATASGSGRMVLAVVNNANSTRLETVTVASATDSIFVWGAQRHVNTSLTTAPKPYQQTVADANTGYGYITQWYDQSGNRNNAIQAIVANQPKIIDGVTGIVLQNNKPSLQFDGNDELITINTINTPALSTAFWVANRGANNQSFMAKSALYASLQNDLFSSYYLNRSQTPSAPNADTKNSLNLYTAQAAISNNNLRIGYGAGSVTYLTGYLSEILQYSDNKFQSVQYGNGNNGTIEQIIESNIKNYYTTP
jgi:type II secretory pathway pseudopilin PulG